MKKIKLDVIAGTQIFVKIAALYGALSENTYLRLFACRLIHTGQHYDNVSESFFQLVNIPEQDLNFGVNWYSF